MEENKDIRGFDLKVDNFRTQLANVINMANLPASVIFFVLKDVLMEVNDLYILNAKNQYQQFCEEAQEEFKKQNEEEEESDNS